MKTMRNFGIKKEVSNAWKCVPFIICTNDINVLKVEIDKYVKNSTNIRDRHFVEFVHRDGAVIEIPIEELI